MTRAFACMLLAAALAGCAAGPSPGDAEAASSWRDCRPGAACANPFEVRVVILTMFEIGEDEGDAPGEFQLWKERRDLTTRVPFPHGHHDVFVNEDTGVLGFVTGIGTMHSGPTTMALGLDQRFDLSHQIDAREKPADWDTGYFARHTKFPFDPARPQPKGEVLVANVGLRDWAFELTRDIELPDSAALAAARAAYTAHENARRPPFVLAGGHIAAMTFWHGALLNDWANRWVHYWSGGATDFVTSAMEETGTFQAITYLHEIGRVDRNRFMVLRAGSNYTMPPPGVTAAANLLRENEGYVGLRAALESLYLVGSRVVDELLGGWSVYRDSIPRGGR